MPSSLHNSTGVRFTEFTMKSRGSIGNRKHKWQIELINVYLLLEEFDLALTIATKMIQEEGASELPYEPDFLEISPFAAGGIGSARGSMFFTTSGPKIVTIETLFFALQKNQNAGYGPGAQQDLRVSAKGAWCLPAFRF